MANELAIVILHKEKGSTFGYLGITHQVFLEGGKVEFGVGHASHVDY